MCAYILIYNNTHTDTYLNELFCLHILSGQSLLACLLKIRAYLQEGSSCVPGMLKTGTSFAGHLPFKLGFQISLAIWILLPPFPSAISLRVLTWLSYRCCRQLHASPGTEVSSHKFCAQCGLFLLSDCFPLCVSWLSCHESELGDEGLSCRFAL